MDSTKRFSSRVADYLKFRPRYPEEVLHCLRDVVGLTPQWAVADIGSGTGFLTELVLRSGAKVQAVEPNREMREAAERRLRGEPGFRSLAGTAEATGLADNSINLIVSGQAFHWFDRVRAKGEFQRILAPRGTAAIVYNERAEEATPFMAGYERLLEGYAVEYTQVGHRSLGLPEYEAFFAPANLQVATFANRQQFDFEGLSGRLRSSSYAPAPDDPRHDPMMKALQALFEVHQREGTVKVEYDTKLYWGRL